MPKQQLRIVAEKTLYHNYAIESKYNPVLVEFCRKLKEEYGWKEFGWDPEGGKWRFSDPKIVRRITKRFPHTVVESGVAGEYKVKKVSWVPTKHSKIPKIEKIKGLKKKLKNYQKEGVGFFISNNGKAILADDMGLGKTLQALAYLVYEKIPLTLVICPATPKYFWAEEAEESTPLKPFVIDKKMDGLSVKETMGIFSNHNLIMINYDLLKKHFHLLNNIKFECLVIDEYHLIKNNSAKRTKLTKLIAKKIPKILLLDGTPMLSRPAELFNALHLIDPQNWNNWFLYTKKYCDGHKTMFGWDYSGASNIEELKQKIKPYFLRRMKEEVLEELPEKNYINVPVILEGEANAKYQKAEGDLAKYLKAYKKKTDSEIKRAMAAKRLVLLNELRQISSIGKIKPLEELLESVLENDKKVVIFSSYVAPLKYLKEKYGDQSVIITGEIKEELRREHIKKFQNDDDVRIFLGGTKSAGVGITLTAASSLIFVDYAWNPADMEQAQDRIRRIGQTAKSINIYQLSAIDTIDQWMKKLLKDKKELVDDIIDNNLAGHRTESYVNTLFHKIEEKYNN